MIYLDIDGLGSHKKGGQLLTDFASDEDEIDMESQGNKINVEMGK